MKKLTMGLLSAISAMLLSGCSASPKGAEVRWRMTVEVDTPDGIRSGSSVWSWQLSRPTLALASPYDGQFRGEAVAVDLPNGKTLFALITDQQQIPERQFRELRSPRDKEDRVADIREIATNVGETRQLRCAAPGEGETAYDYDCPMLVSFVDPSDPISVFEVDYHDAGASLGDGYAIRAINVTITDGEVTTGIEKWLPREFFRKWGAISKAERSKGSVLDNPYYDTLSGKLSRNDFTTESAQ